MYRLMVFAFTLMVAGAARGEKYELMVGVDETLWPAEARMVMPSNWPCCSNGFYDGDRLAGNDPPGPTVDFLGSGTPLFAPNELGSLSFLFRRGDFAFFENRFPWQGIDFLGGPMLDLDGDLNNGVRKLIPTTGQTAVAIPGTTSFVDLTLDLPGGTVTLNGFDAMGTNEGGFGINAGIATTVNVLSGTTTNGVGGAPAINPTVDTRVGSLTPFLGSNGLLEGVYRIESLGFEIWQDTLLAQSGTANTLGTFQFLGTFRGWLVQRDPGTGTFPALEGQGLGTTLWPLVDTSGLGNTYATANGLVGGSATIITGVIGVDDFTAPGNGGTAPTELGAYFDAVVAPRVSALSDAFIYLESAGFGINNSGDPLYLDSVSYDVVLIVQRASSADLRDYGAYQRCFSGAGGGVSTGCEAFDFDTDGDVDFADLNGLIAVLSGP